MSYNLRSRDPDLNSYEEDPQREYESDLGDDESESDAIEDDPFYEPYLEDEHLMNIGRILRYELGRTGEDVYFGEEEDASTPPENTRVVPESESNTHVIVPPLPPPPPLPVEEDAPTHPDRLCAMDFEGLPRYRLSFMCVRYFEWTGIRNIATASSISNDALVRALCQIPRGRAVPDCAICSYPLWDALDTKCCSQPLCIHCVNRCAECPYCRSTEY